MNTKRPVLINVVQSVTTLNVSKKFPYDQLAHRVDRVIKNRDILVVRTESSTV